MGGSDEGTSNDTILVVDDADAIRKMVCAMLTQSGYRCVEASDGTEALRLIEDADGVRLVLTDMVMPKMGGPELAQHISRLRPDVRIIFMSGYTDDPIVRCVERTPSIFLPKPFTTAALMEKIRQSLDLPWYGLPEVRMSNGPDAR